MIVIDYETKCAKYRRKAIDEAVYFASQSLMPRIRKPVYINIRTIRKLAEKQGVYGDCMDEGDREFTIRIDVSLPLDEMISTILHEMVHVWQYLTKRMVSKWVHTDPAIDMAWELAFISRSTKSASWKYGLNPMVWNSPSS